MITRQDLDAAIAECVGERDPTSNTCIKLAAYIIIRNELYPDVPVTSEQTAYSYSGDSSVHLNSGSDFATAVEGLPADSVWAVVDELAQTVKILQPRIYRATLRKFEDMR